MRWNWPAPVPSGTTGSTLTVTLRPSRYTLSFTRWPATYGVTVPSTIMRWPPIMKGGLPRARSTASCTRPGAAGAADGGTGAADGGGAVSAARARTTGAAGDPERGGGLTEASALTAHTSDPSHTHANAAGAE